MIKNRPKAVPALSARSFVAGKFVCLRTPDPGASWSLIPSRALTQGPQSGLEDKRNRTFGALLGPWCSADGAMLVPGANDGVEDPG